MMIPVPAGVRINAARPREPPPILLDSPLLHPLQKCVPVRADAPAPTQGRGARMVHWTEDGKERLGLTPHEHMTPGLYF